MFKRIALTIILILGLSGTALASAERPASAPPRQESATSTDPKVSPHRSARIIAESRWCDNHPAYCRLERKLEKATGRDWAHGEVYRFVDWLEARERAARLADNPPTGCPAGGYDCYRGGIRWKFPCAIPEYICDRESNPYDDDEPGFIDVGNPGSSAAGKYQFVDRSWGYAVRGAGYPQYADRSAGYAPEYVQDAAARWLYYDQGEPGHWDCC